MNSREAKSQRPGGGLTSALGTSVLLFPMLYVGAYFALLDPIGVVEINPPGDVSYYEQRYPAAGTYSGLAAGFLYPIHQIDRWLRPKYWGD